MIIYILVFITSLLFIYLGNKLSNFYFSKKIRVVAENHSFYIPDISKALTVGGIYTVALILPSLLAGFRDYSIGTDILVYGNDWFHNALMMSDINTYVEWAQRSAIGGLYAVFNYVISRFSTNPHIFYFWYSFVESFLVLTALKQNKINIVIGMATYYFLFFNLTLNILRQGMAMVIILWGFKYVTEKKFWKYLLVVFIAMGFHDTSIIAIIIYIFYWLSNNNKNKWLSSSVMFICGLSILFFDKLASIILSSGLLDTRYAVYIDGNNRSGGFLTHLVLCVPILVIYLIARNNNKGTTDRQMYNAFKVLVMFTTLLSMLNLKFVYLGRITLYFDFIFIFAVPYISDNCYIGLKGYRGTAITKAIIFSYLVLYWIIVYGVMNSGETVPYIGNFN